MKSLLTLLLIIATMSTVNSQSKLPYYEIPEVPKEYTGGTVASRMVDGLGFRYYWATEGLTDKDLQFKPSEKGRTTFETVDHILVLSIMTLSAVERTEMSFPKEGTLTFTEMRLDENPSLRQEMESLSGRTSVPQIFIDDQHIGGCDDLYALDASGELDKLVK